MTDDALPNLAMSDATAPIGPRVETTPAKRPGRTTMRGRLVNLSPLDSRSHGDALHEGTRGEAGEQLWKYLFEGPFSDRAAFDIHLQGIAASEDPLFFAILDSVSSTAVGYASYMRIEPVHRVIEVGSILYTPRLQQTTLATEAMYLMARHVFEDLGYRRYEWKCNALNAPSRRAALRLGFRFEGIFRQHMIVKGETGTPRGSLCSIPNGRCERQISSAGSIRRILVRMAGKEWHSPGSTACPERVEGQGDNVEIGSLTQRVIPSAIEGPAFGRSSIWTVPAREFLGGPFHDAGNSRSFDSGTELASESLPSAQDDNVEAQDDNVEIGSLAHSCHPERSRGTCFRPELKSVAIDSWLWDSGRTSEDARAYIGPVGKRSAA